MTNSNLARAVINGILGRIRTAEQVKNSILNIKNRLEKKYQNRELSRDQYLWELEKEIDGKTILEWLHYYDSYILNCKYEIRKHKKTISNNKVLTVFLSLFVVLALFLSTFYLGPTMVGLVIQENVTDDVLLENITEDNVTLDNITEYAEENITEIIETNITKTTEDNITLENITLPDEIIPEDNITIPEENITASVDGVTIITTQLLAILGQPVQWKKHITLDEAKKIKINLPKEAVDISVKKKK